MTPKILVIPSWYPTALSPVVGSFCREQTELVAGRFDLRIIYPTLRVISKKETLGKFKSPASSRTIDHLAGSIPGLELETIVSSFLSEKQRIDFLIAKAITHFAEMIETGWKPDLIHAHGTIYGGIIAAALGRAYGIRVVITEHHSLLVADFNVVRWQLYKTAMESADLIITVSNELKKMILMNGIRCNTIVAGNLINEALFSLPEREEERTGFNILFIGVPALTKDIPTFITALRLLKESGFRDFKATLVIPEVKANLTKEEIVEMCREKGILENCVFPGTLAHERIPEVIRSCDVLVSTSVTETFGLSVAEALICGKPVIATRSGGVEDFVNPGNGILVDIGDAGSIAAGLRGIMDGSFKVNSREVRIEMIARYGREAFEQKICDIYNKLIHDQRH